MPFKSDHKTGFCIWLRFPCYVYSLQIEASCVLCMLIILAFTFAPVILNFILLLTWAILKRYSPTGTHFICTITLLCLTRFKLKCDHSSHFFRNWSVCHHCNLEMILAEVLRLDVGSFNEFLVELFILPWTIVVGNCQLDGVHEDQSINNGWHNRTRAGCEGCLSFKGQLGHVAKHI